MRQLKYISSFFIVLLAVFVSNFPVQAATGPMLEVGEARSLGNEVRVPVTLYKTAQLTSLDAKVVVAGDAKGVRLKSFEPAGLFAGEQYRTIIDISGNTLSFDFLSQTEREPTLGNKPTVIGYITYTLTNDFAPGAAVNLEIVSLRAKGRAGTDLLLEKLEGKIERKLPIGGVISDNGPSAAAALRILQHVDGRNLITEREMWLSADVDGNGKINQDDAQLILDYVAGKVTTFLAIGTPELDNASVGSEYIAFIEAKHGRAPYEFKSRGSLPPGLKLDAQTGELTGTPRTARNYTFTIQVTDAVGNTAERAFAINVIDSNIIKVEKPDVITVKQGSKAQLPAQVLVTYKDKTQGYEKVVWEDVDTSKLGEQYVKGVLGNDGFTITIKVNVVSENYIERIVIEKSPFLDLHTVRLTTSPEVYAVTINGKPMHYEGHNLYSFIVTDLPSGANLTFVLKDKYGNVLETKSESLLPKK